MDDPLSRSAPECVLESQVEGSENQHDAYVRQQPGPDVVPKEQDVDSDHYANKSDDVDPDGQVPPHALSLWGPPPADLSSPKSATKCPVQVPVGATRASHRLGGDVGQPIRTEVAGKARPRRNLTG